MTISADHAAQPAAQQAAQQDPAGDAVSKFGITVEDYMLPARHQIQMVGPDGTLNPHTEQGTQPGHEYSLPSDAELMAAYEQLVIGRRVNDQDSALVRQGRLAVYPSSRTARRRARSPPRCALPTATGCSPPTATPWP